MAYNTGNPIGSADARDLYDNAQNLDKAMNSTESTWVDRLGVTRPTFKGAESELNQKVADAEAAATQALGYLNTMRATSYGPLAEDPTEDPLGNPCTAGDEYFNTTYNLLKRYDGSIWRVPDINTTNLASGAGSSMVGHGGKTVEAALNERLPEIGNYAALRAYTGPVTAFMVRGVENIFDGGFGVFRVDASDTTSADNSGTVLIDASGRRWKRDYSGYADSRWFGAKVGGPDCASEINAALAACINVIVTGGGEYHINSPLMMAQNHASLLIDSGTSIRHTVSTEAGIVVSGIGATISGRGSIISPAVFDGAQGESLVAVIRVDAAGSLISDISIENTPKYGILYKNCSRHILRGVTINGGVPKSFYNDADTNTLNQAGVSYDPPANVVDGDTGLQISGCTVMNIVQGFFAGNYGGAANETGINVTGNIFRHCWDHGCYINGTAADYSIIANNNFYECRQPIVSGGVGSVVENNTCVGVTQDATMEQLISIRDAVGGTYNGNVISGYGASIDIMPLLGTELSNNIVSNNSIRATGPSHAGSGLRLRRTTTSKNNVIRGNIVDCYPTVNFAAIDILGGVNNVATDNVVTSRTTAYTMQISEVSGGDFSANRLTCAGSAASAVIVSMMLIDKVTNCDVTRNRLYMTTDGSNIALRGIAMSGVSVGNNVDDNSFELTAPNLTSVTHIFNVSTVNNNRRRNSLSRTNRMAGSVTWSTGTTSVTVTNANVRSDSSVQIMPNSAQAGTIAKINGVYVTVADGSFTVATSDGANTGASSVWGYVIS